MLRLPMLRGLLIVTLLATASLAVAAEKKKLLLLAQAPDGHPPQSHEYIAGLTILQALLSHAPELDVTLIHADEPWTEGPELLQKADGVVLFLAQGGKWLTEDPRRHDAMTKLAARGGGLSVIHWGMGAKSVRDIGPFLRLFGACHGGPDRKYMFLETELSPASPTEPLTAGIPAITVNDEFYYQLKTVEPRDGLRPLWLAKIKGEQEMVGWAYERPSGGRSFGFSGLHFHENWRRTEYRRLVTHGVLWTMQVAIPPGGANVDVPARLLEPVKVAEPATK
jgi:hypothetical protein